MPSNACGPGIYCATRLRNRAAVVTVMDARSGRGTEIS